MREPIRKILVPTDGSPESEAVFAAIMPLVRAYAPEVAVLYVFEDPDASFMPPARVAKACGALRASNVNAYLELREGLPAEVILRTAREKEADLIAISTHGRGGVVRLIAGSVAEEVLRKTELPLLVTRPKTTVHEWKRIVVALDGSERSESILPEAVRLAEKLGATLDLLRVAIPVVAAGPGEAPILVPPEDPMPYLKSVAQRLKEQGVEARPVALEGRAAESILRHLRAAGASLLCMTTHGRSGLARILLGSVAEEVVRKAPCPVLLQRSVPASAPAKREEKKGVRVV
ncbi:MAG: universal stress protein [Planctomycetes bacterium]|nr:universal stress protein [Planctomycetota bacterium]